VCVAGDLIRRIFSSHVQPDFRDDHGLDRGPRRKRCLLSADPALLFVFVIFYVLMIRPQQRRMKEHAATIGAVQKGDEVITAGGIRGKVTKVADEEVEVEIAQGVKVRVVKSTLSNVLSKSAKPAND
jgi:preprotein translocase subunit YajC